MLSPVACVFVVSSIVLQSDIGGTLELSTGHEETDEVIRGKRFIPEVALGLFVYFDSQIDREAIANNTEILQNKINEVLTETSKMADSLKQLNKAGESERSKLENLRQTVIDGFERFKQRFDVRERSILYLAGIPLPLEGRARQAVTNILLKLRPQGKVFSELYKIYLQQKDTVAQLNLTAICSSNDTSPLHHISKLRDNTVNVAWKSVTLFLPPDSTYGIDQYKQIANDIIEDTVQMAQHQMICSSILNFTNNVTEYYRKQMSQYVKDIIMKFEEEYTPDLLRPRHVEAFEKSAGKNTGDYPEHIMRAHVHRQLKREFPFLTISTFYKFDESCAPEHGGTSVLAIGNYTIGWSNPKRLKAIGFVPSRFAKAFLRFLNVEPYLKCYPIPRKFDCFLQCSYEFNHQERRNELLKILKSKNISYVLYYLCHSYREYLTDRIDNEYRGDTYAATGGYCRLKLYILTSENTVNAIESL